MRPAAVGNPPACRRADLRRVRPPVRAYSRDMATTEGASAATAEALARRMTEHLHGLVDTLENPQDTATAFDETLRCARAHVEQVERLLAEQAPASQLVLPRDAAEHARSFVRRRLPLSDLLKTYRLGHRYLAGELGRRLGVAVADADERGRVLAEQSAFLFEYVDRSSDLVVEVFHDEERRWNSSAAAVRAETVRALLAGEPLDQQLAERRLGHALGGRHVGVVLSTDGHDHDRLRRAAEAVAQELGAGRPLVVPVSSSTVWAWCTLAGADAAGAVDAAAITAAFPGVATGLGRPRPGIPGFRVTHEEAAVAARYAATAAGAGAGCVSYPSVELVSLVAEDAPRAGRFVRETLGDLSADDPRTAQLRETVLTYLRSGKSPKLAAGLLHMHPNGVKLRITRAERLHGSFSSDWGLRMEAALTLAEALGPAVLRDPDAADDAPSAGPAPRIV